MYPIFSQMPHVELQQYSLLPQTLFPHLFDAGTQEHERVDHTSPWMHICV